MHPGQIVRPLALISLMSVSGLAHAARQDGLVAYFTFDDVNDPLHNYAPAPKGRDPIQAAKIGDGLDARYGVGHFGRAAVFDNLAQPNAKEPAKPVPIKDWAISLGKIDDVYAGSFTVACWVDIPVANPGMIISNKDTFASTAPGWSFNAKYADHYQIRAAGESKSFSAFTVALEKKWRHVAYVVNRATGNVGIYVDGKKDKEYKLPASDAALGSGLATVIGASATGTFGSNCSVDELGIWNRALSESEIVALGGPPGKRIPEASSFAWAGAGVVVAAVAAGRRRRLRAKSE